MTIQINNREVKSWKELNPEEYLEIFRIIYSPWYQDSQRATLLKFLSEVKINSSWLIDQISVSRSTLYGPKDKLRNVTFLEFIFVDTFYSLYMQKQEGALDKLIAVLFRAKDKKNLIKGDIREDFNENLIDNRLKNVAFLPEYYKQAIVFNYGTWRKWIELQYPFVFPRNGGKRDATAEPKGIKTPGWEKHLKKLAKGASDKDLHEIGDSLVLNILDRLNTMIEESRKKKRK